MAYMQACAGRVGEHVKHIIFGLTRVFGNFINLAFLPFRAPLFLNAFDLVFAVIAHDPEKNLSEPQK
jgi:hypothetical protein